MDFWKDTHPIVISCAKGLAPQTAKHLERMGYTITNRGDTTVTVNGGLRDIMQLNLRLRTAHRVLVPLMRTRCCNLDYLYNDIYEVPWDQFLEPEGYFTVNSIVYNDSVRDTRMPGLKAKDAIADRMRSAFGLRPDSGREFIGASIFIYWEDDNLEVYLDTTGEALSRRGYRKLPWKAPMQETLAAACVLESGWDGNSPFIAPMCGSGTPAIEAALIAINRAAGSFKSHFGFMSLNGYRQIIPGEKAGVSVRKRFGASPEQIWKSMVAEAKAQEKTEGLPPIIASDLSDEAVEIARMNAIAAGVSQYITFVQCDFAATKVPEQKGVVFMNPEYGERLGDGDELPALYARIGDFLKQRCVGYTGCVFTGSMELSRMVGLRSSRRVPFYNGPIDCRLLVYDLFEGALEDMVMEETEPATEDLDVAKSDTTSDKQENEEDENSSASPEVEKIEETAVVPDVEKTEEPVAAPKKKKTSGMVYIDPELQDDEDEPEIEKDGGAD
ncbi:MAG: class I SAM-dependent RNA methyltransferase [Kiritimatiellae bacterium]|nr:class I SAM-dependent RNA methyltransferase [Kiritimatiellia bacterium]